MKALIFILFISFCLNACSFINEQQETVTAEEVTYTSGGVISERRHTVDVLTPSSDVVGVVPSRRHTLGYGEKYERYNVARTLPMPKQKVIAQAKDLLKTNSEPKNIWDRYCAGDYMSSAEENSLDKQPIPEKWQDNCRPMK